MKYFLIVTCFFMFSCAHTKNIAKEQNDAVTNNNMPKCLANVVKEMSANPAEGTPMSVTRYHYKGKQVYYLVSPCCDKYNIVYDNDCHILGYPDGGFTGRGDGKMIDFKKEATNATVVWQPTENK